MKRKQQYAHPLDILNPDAAMSYAWKNPIPKGWQAAPISFARDCHNIANNKVMYKGKILCHRPKQDCLPAVSTEQQLLDIMNAFDISLQSLAHGFKEPPLVGIFGYVGEGGSKGAVMDVEKRYFKE